MGNKRFSYRNVAKQLQNSPSSNVKRGLLYISIATLYGEYQTTQEWTKTKETSDLWNIKQSNYLKDDFDLCHQILECLALAKSSDINKDEPQMEWLVFITASILVGSTVCYQYYLKSLKQQAPNPSKVSTSRNVVHEDYQPSLPPPIPAILCLVLPASIAANLYVQQELNAIKIKKLVDSAFYFMCTQKTEADAEEGNLSFSEASQAMPTDSQKEVYVRIKIDNGRAVIDKKTRYGLKDDLPESASGSIQKIACLKDLSGLGKFVRI